MPMLGLLECYNLRWCEKSGVRSQESGVRSQEQKFTVRNTYGTLTLAARPAPAYANITHYCALSRPAALTLLITVRLRAPLR